MKLAHVRLDAEADGEADPVMMATTPTLRTRSAMVRPASTAERAIGQRPEPLDQALLQVLGEADGGR